MRTNIDIDDSLLKQAMKGFGKKTTKKKVVEEGLKLLAALADQAHIKNFRGKLKWRGSLNKLRAD